MNKIEALSDGETDYSLISKEYRALFGTTKYKCTIVFIGTEKEAMIKEQQTIQYTQEQDTALKQKINKKPTPKEAVKASHENNEENLNNFYESQLSQAKKTIIETEAKQIELQNLLDIANSKIDQLEKESKELRPDKSTSEKFISLAVDILNSIGTREDLGLIHLPTKNYGPRQVCFF